jgi:hypothetical protein
VLTVAKRSAVNIIKFWKNFSLVFSVATML